FSEIESFHSTEKNYAQRETTEGCACCIDARVRRLGGLGQSPVHLRTTQPLGLPESGEAENTRGRKSRLGQDPGGRVRAGEARKPGYQARSRRGQDHFVASRDIRFDRLAADARGGQRVFSRRLARRV